MNLAEFLSILALRLVVGSEELVLSHVGSTHIVLRHVPETVTPSSAATLEVTVDGVSRKSEVHLPHGIRAGERKILYF